MITNSNSRRQRLLALAVIAMTSFSLSGCSEMEGRSIEGERQRLEGEADRLKQDATDRAGAEAERLKRDATERAEAEAKRRAREEINSRLGG